MLDDFPEDIVGQQVGGDKQRSIFLPGFLFGHEHDVRVMVEKGVIERIAGQPAGDQNLVWRRAFKQRHAGCGRLEQARIRWNNLVNQVQGRQLTKHECERRADQMGGSDRPALAHIQEHVDGSRIQTGCRIDRKQTGDGFACGQGHSFVGCVHEMGWRILPFTAVNQGILLPDVDAYLQGPPQEQAAHRHLVDRYR